MLSALFIAAALVISQQVSGTFVVQPNVPLRVSFEAVPAPDNTFRWGCVNAVAGQPSPVPVLLVVATGAVTTGGRVVHTAQVPALQQGVYGCAVAVSNTFTVNNNLPEVTSDPIAAIVGTTPDKPLNVILVVR